MILNRRGSQLTNTAQPGHNEPTTHMPVCVSVCSASQTVRYSPSSWNDEVRATPIHQVLHQQYTEISLKKKTLNYNSLPGRERTGMQYVLHFFWKFIQKGKDTYKASSFIFFFLNFKNILKNKTFIELTRLHSF